MGLGLPNFRLAPWVAALEAVQDLGLPGNPPGGSTDPNLSTKTWASAPGVITDGADPDAVYEALVTGEAPLAVKSVRPMWAPDDWTQDALIGATTFGAAYLSGGTSLIATGLGELAEYAGIDQETIQNAKLASSVAGNVYDIGGSLMFEDFDFSSILDFGSDFIEEIDFGSVLDLGTTALTTFVGGQGSAQAIPVMSKAPQIAGAVGGAVARTGAVVGRSFFNKWPNLATAIQKMKNAGHNISRSKLYSMMKRFGPDFLVTGGILSAAAVSELIMAGPGHRRMNVGNVKALRRGMRRIESFHKLCTKADMLRSRGRRYKKAC